MDGFALILAVIAVLMAFRMRRGLAGLQARMAGLADEVGTLRAQIAVLRAAMRPEAPSAPEVPEVQPEADEPGPVTDEPAGAAGPAPMPERQSAQIQPEVAGQPVAPAPPPAQPPAAAASLEERLGTRWAVWVGGLALAVGGVLLVLYSIDQGVFGPEVQVGLGAALALILVACGEWFRRAERATPVAVVPTAHIPGILTAAGTVAAFATVYGAYAHYGFVGPAAAFVLLGGIAIATMLAAALQGPALAGLGLAGALVVPMLVSSDQPSAWPLVLYLIAVAGAAYALARLRRWLWLAAAVVAGALVWGLVLLSVLDGAGATALLVHIAVQLGLAALCMAVEPHLATADADAWPDWIAGLALVALTALAVLALDATRAQAQWTYFAVAALAILGATAWRSAPAASAAVLGGAVALAGIAVWPGLAAPPDPSLLAPALQGVLRLPENVVSFLAFAALSTLSISALAALRLWRGPALPQPTAGLYALAAVVPSLLALVLAYLRVTQFDRSISFGLLAVVLAAIFYLIADRFDRIAAEAKTPATRLAIGGFASGVAAAMALAFAMALDRGYLTVAFAVTAFTTAIFAVVDRIALLRYVVVAIGLVVLGRLAWDPRIMGADVGTWPIFNWLLLGYGLPALAFLAAARILRREVDDVAVRICDALGVLFAALLVFFQIRHALNGGDPLAQSSGHVEQGLIALMSLGFAGVLIRMDLGRTNPVFRAASLIFGVISAGVTLVGLGLAENPLFTSEAVRGPVVLSTLLIAYLLPGVAAVAVARMARGVRPAWYVRGAAVLALLLVFGYVTLTVRHAFQGEHLSLWRDTGAPEVWSYSVAWLVLGLAVLGYGLLRASIEARLASAALVVLSVLKVFLYDVTGLGGFWRAFSVICLGVVLIGIGLVYQRLVFARPPREAGE